MTGLKSFKVEVTKHGNKWRGLVRLKKHNGIHDTIKLPVAATRKAVFDMAFKALKAYDYK